MWLDDLEVKAYITTSGDYVSLGVRTEYPFTSGGPNGVPFGWTPIDTSTASYVNKSVGLGRFNISNARTDSVNNGQWYGAYKDFPVDPTTGQRYIINVQARVMEGKSGCQRYVSWNWQPQNASPSGAYSWGYSDWEQIALNAGLPPAGQTSMRVFLYAMYYPSTTATDGNWGMQFQNLALITQEASYPDPTWEDISCDIKGMSTRYGRDKFVNRYDVGTLTMTVDNNDGHFTYKPNGVLRPGRFLRVVIRSKADPTKEYAHYYGVLDTLTDGYTLDGKAVTVINAVDTSSLLSNMHVPTASFASSTFVSGQRFKNLLAAVGWRTSGYYNIDSGVYIQQAIMANGRTVRDELGLIADSEGSYFFCARDGQVNYRERTWDDPEVNMVTAELMAMPEETLEYPDPIVGYSFLFPKVTGNSISLPSTYMLPTGDIDVRVRVMHDAMDFVGSSGAQTYFSRNDGTNTEINLYRQYNRITLTWAGYGRNNPTDIPFGNGQPHWIRATRAQADGAMHFYYANDSETEPTQWVDAGVSGIPPWTPPAHVAAPLHVGDGYSTSTRRPFGGRFFRLIIRNGVNGPIWLDMSDDNANTPGQTSFIGTTGQTWTVNQTAGVTIVHDDTYYPPSTGLPVVDTWPDMPGIPIICLRDLQPIWSRDRVINEVSLANQGGNAITTVDAESQRQYGPKTFQRMDFLNDDTHTEYLVERTKDYMDGYTDAILRVDTVQFRPNSPESYKWAMEVFLNWIVRIRYQHPTNGWGFALVTHVQGIEHAHSLSDWVITLQLDNPETFTYWETPDLGTGWDLGGWDDDIWDGAADPNTNAYWDAKYPWSDPVSKWG